MTLRHELSNDFVNENFNFFSTTLRGTKQIKPRWKRVVASTDDALGEALGKLYVADYFPPEAKARALEMVNNLKERWPIASRRSTGWTSRPNRKRSRNSPPSTSRSVIPDKWRDYSLLKIDQRPVCFERHARREFRGNRAAEENRQTGRSKRMGHDAADGERLLQPEHERDRFPGRAFCNRRSSIRKPMTPSIMAAWARSSDTK